MALAEGGRIYWREWREDRWRLEGRIGTAKGHRGGASRRAGPKVAQGRKALQPDTGGADLLNRERRPVPSPPRPRRPFERGRAPCQTRSVLPKAAGGPAVKTV